MGLSIGDLDISGSINLTGSFIISGTSGAFTGSFNGDGSALTGVTGSWDGTFSGSAIMSGSVDMSGSITANSFTGDGSGLTGVTGEWDGSHTGSATISGSLEIDGRVSQIGLGSSTFFGFRAGESDDKTNNFNTAIGDSAFRDNATGTSNTALGYEAIKVNTNGSGNTAVGARSLNSNNASYNTAVGNLTLNSDNSGDYNVALGHTSLYSNTSGDSNTSIGSLSMYSNTTGNGNVALGYRAGFHTTGSSTNNIFIGRHAGPASAGSVSNRLYIGNESGSALIEGDFSLDQVTINGSLTASGISIPTGKDLVFPGHSKITMDGDFTIEKQIGNNAVISETGAGDLMLLSNNEVEIKSGEAGETFAKFTKDAGIELYTNNVKKFETTATGVIVSGSITGSSITVGSLTSAINPAIHAKTSNTSENILLESTDTGAGSAPDLVLFRNAGAPSDNDTLGVIEYKANQTGGSNPFVYNGIYSRIIDASQQQSALTISAFYGSSTSHAIGIHNLADNTTSGAVIINPTGFAQVPKHTLDVQGDARITTKLIITGSVTGSSFTGSFVGDGSGLTNVGLDNKFQVFVTGSNGTSGLAQSIMPLTGSSTIDHHEFSSILGGSLNKLSGSTSIGHNVIAGGIQNVIQASGRSTIAGGSNNSISGSSGDDTWNFIGGGYSNEIGYSGSIEGVNTTNGKYVVVAGGSNNTARGIYTVIGGGAGNHAGGTSVIAGGFKNYANASFTSRAFIGGGTCNSASACTTVIAGGSCNKVEAQFSVIGGGLNNLIASTAQQSALVGGQYNTGSGDWTFNGAGRENVAAGDYSSVVGGKCNVTNTNADYSSIVGGCSNTINTNKCYSGILGGCNNTVAHTGSFAIGKDITTTAADTTFVNNFIASGSGTTVVVFKNLPTSDPTNAGQVWNDGGTLKISAG